MFRVLVLIMALLAVAAPVPAFAQSLERMAGQMLLFGFAGDGPSDASVKAITAELGSGGLGGVMYLKTNVKSLNAVEAMNAAFLAAAPDLPPFIALDQEGGIVERLTKAVGFTEVPSARTVAARYSPHEAAAIYGRMAKSLVALGFTVNFGPVVDLDTNPDNPIIGKYGRSFSADPKTVIGYAEAFIGAHRAAGLITALKHFPGHGSSTADSHKGFVDITRTWKPAELDPYKALISRGYDDMVMVGHLYNAKYDPDGSELPSSLSKRWITGVLRGELGYHGVVITDDLDMGAIRKRFSIAQAAIMAVEAGADILLVSNTAEQDPKLVDKLRAALVAKAESDPAFKARIVQSYNRIVAVKQRIAARLSE